MITAPDLPGMLGDLALTASKDDTLPMFTAVRLYRRGDHLYGWSTDRYRAGQARCVIQADDDTPISFALGRSECLSIAKTFKRAESAPLELSATTSTVRIVRGHVVLELPVMDVEGLSTVPAVLGRELPEESGVQHFQPEFLCDFATIAKRRRELVGMALSKGMRANHVRIGPDYRGWLMPVREDAVANGPWEWMTPEW